MPSLSFTQLEMQASLEYWTPERMANARPSPLLHVEIPKKSQQKYDKFSKVETEMSFCGAMDNEYEHVPADSPPGKRAGRLYYKSPYGEDCYSTAQLVGAMNMLLTTASCLKIPGQGDDGWSTSIVFEKGRNGQQSQNILIAINSIHLSDGWDETGGTGISQVKWNYGFVKTKALTDRGHFMLSTSFPVVMKAIGYPKNGGNKQVYMCSVVGVRGNHRPDGACYMYGNYMDDGADGGGWFKKNYENNFIYGINAGNDDSGLVYGPVFDENIFYLLNRALTERQTEFWHSGG